jgi:hypothetical protein
MIGKMTAHAALLPSFKAQACTRIVEPPTLFAAATGTILPRNALPFPSQPD